MALRLEVAESIAKLPADAWDALAAGMPLLSHAFLSAFETSNSVGAATGWQPCFLLLYDDTQLIGAMPLYVKYHSYGEYVFDWAWAEAYERNGLSYYPKLVSAIPFTPITSSRLLANHPDTKALIVNALSQIMRQNKMSSAHVLFPDADSAEWFKQAGWMQRQGVQFRWQNLDYSDFDEFLSQLSHDKRKKIRQERKKVTDSGVICLQVKGGEITPEQWNFFYQCYENTYREHRSTPYLTREFFTTIGNSMPQNILLILAYLDEKPIAAALNIYDEITLYGRYWGSMQYVPNLHFELCYYQAQIFCITEKIEFFEGGAQGEHKLARGFKARPTCSFHQIANPDFAAAIEDFVVQESKGLAAYANELDERAPFKSKD
ncbi:GNAT family N-acetyltransferase [Methylotenera sp.]|uniref:GNAT family N-acetyltransferase n=1 Tax=Methylotenera sp. TaxID=2051956 RepID=UPI002732902D|nr:GNAT family N-acetyltransferase [Methylotenera sp.]MDP3777185.1 GNAT family N-acetyltransferase [Methylotenera sp.]